MKAAPNAVVIFKVSPRSGALRIGFRYRPGFQYMKLSVDRSLGDVASGQRVQNAILDALIDAR